MRKTLFAFLTFLGCTLGAQVAELNNFGNLYVHPDGNLGIHIDLFNNGEFLAQENSLIGFYGELPNIIGGTSPIFLFDVEFGNEVGSFLQQQMDVSNNANFVSGNVVTAQNVESDILNFGPNAFYTGETDAGKVVGYAAVVGQGEFIFPIGDRTQLRPLVLNSTGSDQISSSTYIRENPTNPTVITERFNTDSKTRDVGEVSTSEFWILNHSQEATITLSWNEQSNLLNLAPDISGIILVGWSIAANQWISLSGANGIGTMTEGIITSDSFLPDRYAAITFAGTPSETDTFAVNNPTLGNYFLTPNGDGINDFLVIDNLDEAGSNTLIIYNKFGQKVFEMANYTNQFGGIANTGTNVIKRDIGLPEGIYYYIVQAPDIDLTYQGFLFLDR